MPNFKDENPVNASRSLVSTTAALAAVSFSFFAGGCGEHITARSEIPTNFTMQAKYFTWGTNMTFKDSGGAFATIEAKHFHLTPTFEYYDGNHNLQAKAQRELFTWGTKIEIKDNKDVVLGSVEKHVIKTAIFSLGTKVKTYYAVKDASGHVVAESEKVDFGGTDFQLKKPNGDVVATMNRPMIDLGAATWNVHINHDPGFDKRLILFIPAFKTSADNSK